MATVDRKQAAAADVSVDQAEVQTGDPPEAGTSNGSGTEEHGEHSPRLIDIIDRLYQGKEVFFHYIRFVEDIMNKEVKFLTLDHKIKDALGFLEENGVRHIPILEELEPEKRDKEPTKHVLTGIVSQRDVARVLSPGVGTLLEADEDEKSFAKSLGSVITRDLHTVRPRTSVVDAVQIMLQERIDSLPVVVGPEKEPELVGIVTTTDVIRCFIRMEVLRKSRQEKPRSARLIDFARARDANQPTDLLVDALMGRVGDVMQDNVLTVKLDDDLHTAVRLMQQHRIRHLPVLDAKGGLKGMLSDRDVIRYLPPADRKPPGKNEGPPKFRDGLFRLGPEDEATQKALATDVRFAMSGSPVTVEIDTPLVKVADIFCSRTFGAVPVVAGQDARVAGIITTTDFLASILTICRLLDSSALASPYERTAETASTR